MACIRIPNGSPTGPPTGCSGSEETPLPLPYLFAHLARPGSRFDFPVERPRAGLVSPPLAAVGASLGAPSAGARRNQWPLAAGAVGICGLLTVGYPSIADSGGYGRCGFRPMGVPRRSASSWSSMCQPRDAPHGAWRVPVTDLALGNSVGAIRMVRGTLPVRR